MAGDPLQRRTRGLADSRLSKNPEHHAEDAGGKSKTGIPGERSANLMTHLLNIDPPDHTRLRRLVSKAFTPRRIAEFAPRVQQLTDDLIDGFASRGEADLIHDFAFPSPSTRSATSWAFRGRIRTTCATGQA